MSIQQPLLLLPESLGDIPPLPVLMLLAVASGIVILCIYWLGRSCIEDKPLSETESEQLARFTQEMIEQLNGIAVALRDTIPEASRVLDQEYPATKGLPSSDGRSDDGSGGTATQEEGIAKRGGTLDETSPRTHSLPLGSTIETLCSVTHDKALAQLATKMHKLGELTNRMEDERLALRRNVMDPRLTSEAQAPSRHYLTFTLGEEHFAVSTLNIHEVVEAIQLIAEPCVPPKIRRAIRLRGVLVPVIDIGARFGWHNIALNRNSRIVILEVPSADRLQLIGVVVDTVGKVLELPPTEIGPPTASGSRIRDDFTLGTLTVDSRPVTLLDIGRGVSANELAVPYSAPRSTRQENAPI